MIIPCLATIVSLMEPYSSYSCVSTDSLSSVSVHCPQGHCVAYFPIVVIKYPDKNNLQEKGFILIYVSGEIESIKRGNIAAGKEGMVLQAGSSLVKLLSCSKSRQRTGSSPSYEVSMTLVTCFFQHGSTS